MGDDDASVVLLTCTDELPGRASVDPFLARDVRRIVVAGRDADLAAVLVRLLRRDRLDVELAYVPTDRRSVAARLWGLPHGRSAGELARHGVARPAPLVRDDSGGVLVGRGEIRGPSGAVHGEAYCDGRLVLRGAARRLVVTPRPGAAPAYGGIDEPAPAGVAVRASRWGALPDGSERPVPPTARTGRGASVGRAVQVGCLPAVVVHDGVEHPRPITRWSWYRHVTDWLLVRP